MKYYIYALVKKKKKKRRGLDFTLSDQEVHLKLPFFTERERKHVFKEIMTKQKGRPDLLLFHPVFQKKWFIKDVYMP